MVKREGGFIQRRLGDGVGWAYVVYGMNALDGRIGSIGMFNHDARDEVRVDAILSCLFFASSCSSLFGIPFCFRLNSLEIVCDV